MLSVPEEVERLLDQIRAVTNNPAIVRASDKLQVLCAAHFGPDVSPIPPGLGHIHFTASEARTIALLYARRGKTTRRDSLVNVMIHDPGDGPQDKIVDVRICKIRSKIKDTAYKIETARGVGYRMLADVAA